MHQFKLFRSLALLPILLGSPAFAQQTADAAPEREVTAETVVADVNGAKIRVGHMLALRSRLPEQYQQIPDEQLFPGLLQQLIDQTLLQQRAMSTGADDTLRLRVLIENETRSLVANSLVGEIIDEAVTEEALESAYQDAVAGMTQAQQFNASHILVETQEEATSIAADLQGGADFAETAREKSTGPSGPNGGSLGWFGAGDMVPTFDAVVQTMTVGEISEPVETQFGWHVIKLNDTRLSPLPSRQELEPELRNTIGQQALRSALEALRADASVQTTDPQVPVSILSTIDLNAE